MILRVHVPSLGLPKPAVERLKQLVGLRYDESTEVLKLVGDKHPNKVLTRDQILNLTRNRDWEPFDRSIDIRIARLRRKVEPNPGEPQAIRTIRGAGYMFVPRGT